MANEDKPKANMPGNFCDGLTFDELERPVDLTLTVGEWGCVFEMLCVYAKVVDVIDQTEKYAIHMHPILKKMRGQIEGATNENLSKFDH